MGGRRQPPRPAGNHVVLSPQALRRRHERQPAHQAARRLTQTAAMPMTGCEPTAPPEFQRLAIKPVSGEVRGIDLRQALFGRAALEEFSLVRALVVGDGMSVSPFFFPPREAGRGDRPKGGGRASALRHASTLHAPPPCFAWSPSPALRAVADKRKRSRDACASEFCRYDAQEAEPDPVMRRRRWSRLPADHAQLNKSGRRDAERRVSFRPHPSGCGRDPSGAARLSASHHGTCGSERTPPLSSRNVLPGTRLKSWRYPPPPVPVQRHGRRPVIVPAGRLPEAAREPR